MKSLRQLLKKKTKFVVGLMSGTSADGIDAVVVRISGSGFRSKLRLLAHHTYAYPPGFKRFLLKNSDASSATLDNITLLNMLIAKFFARATKNIVRRAHRSLDEIDLVGSHGQTIHHLPKATTLFGTRIHGTLQLGSPSAIAKLTGVVTVGDFRTGDVAVGGTGAPLVPYFDYLKFRSKSVSRAVLNIGGIANITVLPKGCTPEDVVAFDTGPGNMVIDSLMTKFYNKKYDDEGRVAFSGKILPALLRRMLHHPYVLEQPPKSTGRETFGESFVRSILKHARGAARRDVIATVTEFSALCIYWHYVKFVRPKTRIEELLVCGGGVHNLYLMNALRRYFGGIRIMQTEAMDIPSDAKEAVCFALLANEALEANRTNMPGATGARRSTTLGTICLP